MKLTDLVGRLAPKYPGLGAEQAVNFDGWIIRVPGIEPVTVSEYDLRNQTFDDQVVELIESRIERRMERQSHA